jgi:hypothetical protein
MRMGTAVFLTIAAALPLSAQTWTPPPAPSLAERARQIREEKEKAGGKKATRVITNDEMKAVAPPPDLEEKPAKAEDPSKAEDKDLKKATAANLQEIEKQYHRQSTLLHKQLKQAQMEAEKLKDDMTAAAPNSVTVQHRYYDPKRLKELQAAIDENDKQVASLQKQIADLKEEVHSKGYPDSWADPE